MGEKMNDIINWKILLIIDDIKIGIFPNHMEAVLHFTSTYPDKSIRPKYERLAA